MKKIILLLLVFVSFLLINGSSVFACSMSVEYIQLNEGGNKCSIYPNYHYRGMNITDLDKSNIDKICPDFSLTETDKEIIFESLEKLKSAYGYTHIEKQTDEEYSAFQNEMKKVNSAICDCSKINFHERKGIWTIYTDSFKDSCSFSTACYQPPFYCQNSMYFTPILFLVGVVIIMIGIITGIIFFIKKRKK